MFIDALVRRIGHSRCVDGTSRAGWRCDGAAPMSASAGACARRNDECLGLRNFNWALQTPRLTVRPMRVADADAYHRVRGLMPFDPQHRSLDESRALVAAMVTRNATDAEGWGQFAIIDRSDGSFVGDLGVNFDTPRARQAELGFAIDPARRRQGLALEATGAMVDALFASGRTRVTALTDIRNIAAQRLLARLRFRIEAHFVSSWQDGDQWHDELAYARLASE